MRKLGAGGMAEVFLVKAVEGPLAGQQFAMKRLLPALVSDAAARKSFQREAEVSLHLRHANVVAVYDVIESDDEIAMIMEFVDGRDTAQIIKRCKTRALQWPLEFALHLISALLEGLSYAHTLTLPSGVLAPVVHCDVSPQNFFVSRVGDLKLGDFGVAKTVGAAATQEVYGKIPYLSPEAFEGQQTVDSDLWAAAVLLYELVTLQKPFVGKDEVAVAHAIRARRFVAASDLRALVPEAVDALFARAFAPSLNDRFVSATEFRDELQRLYDPNIGTPLAIASLVRGLFGTAG
jgi:eukaryotic-like serine/threonine-protein kinase